MAYRSKFEGTHVGESCIKAFLRQVEAVRKGDTGLIAETDIRPAADIPRHDTLTITPDASLLGKTVILKLNGGLGTGMGLREAKSLLRIKGDDTFLDLIVKQIASMRVSTGERVRFMLMNSFSTSEDTRAYLAKRYPDIAASFGEVELMQNKVPKVRQDTLEPVDHPQDREMEWVPPGHGDLYAALYSSGRLDALLAEGYRYMFVSNSDNLGATLDPRILTYFAKEGLDFLMEVCERTAADKKGGHLAASAFDGRLLLRESAQCPPADEAAFQDIARHRYFNSNNLWINLESLRRTMNEHDGTMPLPTIRNAKTVDPTDPTSTPVFQLETAMGAAISLFPKAQALVVARDRFAPVKTTADLLSLRSDAFLETEDHRIVLAPSRAGQPPIVTLDGRYKFVGPMDALIPHGAPSMIRCRSLNVKGAMHFASGVVLVGDVSFVAQAQDVEVASGEYTGEVKV